MDILSYDVKQTGQNVQIPQFSIEFKVVASNDQSSVIEDNTLTKKILFPNILQNLPNEMVVELRNYIADWFVQKAVERLSQ